MSDDKSKRSADRRLVSASEDYEVEYLMKKHHASRDVVLAAIKAAGPGREAVERHLLANGAA